MPARYPDPNLPWPICMEAVRLIAEKEQCRLKAYPDPISRGKPWTIGWGETDGVNPGDVWTQDYADHRFLADLTHRSANVRAMCTLEPDKYELGALVSLAYNIGLRRDTPTKGGLYWSMVLRLHNEGKKNEAARAFLLFNKARDPKGNLIEVDGLTTRRMAEAALYLTPEEGTIEPMPQVVANEPSLKASPTMGTGTVLTGAGGAVAMATTWLDPDTLTQWAGVLERFGVKPLWALAGFLIGAGALIVYRRLGQRNDGRA
jgi:lysozyme